MLGQTEDKLVGTIELALR